MSAENRQKAQQVMSTSPVISRTTALLRLERRQRRASQSSLKVAEKKGRAVPNSVDQAPSLDEALGLLPLHFVAKNGTENTFLQLLPRASARKKKVLDVRRGITVV